MKCTSSYLSSDFILFFKENIYFENPQINKFLLPGISTLYAKHLWEPGKALSSEETTLDTINPKVLGNSLNKAKNQ